MNFKPKSALASALVLIFATACSSSGPKSSGDMMDGDMAMADGDIKARMAALEAREAELTRREKVLSEMSTREGSSIAASGGGVGSGADLLPPGASPGQCFTRAWNPPQYREVKEQKMLAEASDKVEVVPAQFGKVKKRVLIAEASTKIEVIPATYKTVTERVLVKPETTVIEPVEAVYETVEERVLDKPAHTVWKKGTGPIQRIDESTGEIMCLVEVPATYKTIKKQVLKTPASTRTKVIPAEYATVKKRVIDKPASTKTIEIPAKYDTVSVTEMVKPAQEKRIPIPAKYTTVTRSELVAEGKMGWREILCETNATTSKIRELQTALKAAGYDPGPIDGDVGRGTMQAVNAYQKAKGLPVDNYLNAATLRSLGVSLR